MKTLAERYAFASRIPMGAFTIKEVKGNGREIEVTGKIADLPPAYCTVGPICVWDDQWRTVFNEEQLADVEYWESQLPHRKKQSPCSCHH